MTQAQIRTVMPAVYAIAVVLAALFADGTTLVAVAVVGAMLLGVGYSLTRPAVGRDCGRARHRA